MWTDQLHCISHLPTGISMSLSCSSNTVQTVKNEVGVNKRRWTTSRQPGRYIAVNRVWHSGDIVEVHLPMELRTEPLPGHPDVVAILYGPIVLAGRLGRKGLKPGADIIVNERTYGDVLKDEVEVPVLIGDAREIVRQIKPSTGGALTFHTTGIGHPSDVSLMPYYRIAHERYNLYWKVVKLGDVTQSQQHQTI